MKIPGNISYLLKIKENYKLPENFNDYIVNRYFNLYSFHTVEDYRKSLLNNFTSLSVTDCGAGSKAIKSSERIISKITQTSATTPDFGSLYQKIIDNFKINSVLELGTSLGIGTMYFALASPEVEVTTIEGCYNTYNFTQKNFKTLGISNVKFINGNFDEIFDNAELEPNKYDMFFIDGNHKSESVIKYYNYIASSLANHKSIIIIDDINWSTDMYKAWKSIVKNSKNCLSINLFRMGIIFKGYDYPKKKLFINFTK